MGQVELVSPVLGHTTPTRRGFQNPVCPAGSVGLRRWNFPEFSGSGGEVCASVAKDSELLVGEAGDMGYACGVWVTILVCVRMGALAVIPQKPRVLSEHTPT